MPFDFGRWALGRDVIGQASIALTGRGTAWRGERLRSDGSNGGKPAQPRRAPSTSGARWCLPGETLGAALPGRF